MNSIIPTVFVPPSFFSVHHGGREAENLKIVTGLTKKHRNVMFRTRAVSEVSDPIQAVATWQIVVGSLAGVTPFVVAGIEFSKRIVAQRNCRVCKGSGLVLRDKKYYFRCPNCGGFLPWQSWKRFFTG